MNIRVLDSDGKVVFSDVVSQFHDTVNSLLKYLNIIGNSVQIEMDFDDPNCDWWIVKRSDGASVYLEFAPVFIDDSE